MRQDLDSVSEFIRDYCTKYQRWPSAKFLAGESYGTTRAAGVSGYLAEIDRMQREAREYLSIHPGDLAASGR